MPLGRLYVYAGIAVGKDGQRVDIGIFVVADVDSDFFFPFFAFTHVVLADRCFEVQGFSPSVDALLNLHASCLLILPLS